MEIKTKYNIGDRVYRIYREDDDLTYAASCIASNIEDINISQKDNKSIVNYTLYEGFSVEEEDLYPSYEEAAVAALKRSIKSVDEMIKSYTEKKDQFQDILNSLTPDKPSKKVEITELSFGLYLNAAFYFVEIQKCAGPDTDEYICYVNNDSDLIWEWTFDSDGRTYADFPNNDISNIIMEYLFTKVFK